MCRHLLSIVVLATAFFLPGCMEHSPSDSAANRAESCAASEPSNRSDQSGRTNERDETDVGIRVKESVVRAESGDVKVRITRITRNGERIMDITWAKTTKNAHGHAYARGYWQSGELVLIEGDGDGDGVFDIMIVSGGQGPVQAYDEKPNGRLVAVEKERLAKMKEDYAFMLDVMTPIADAAKKGVSEEEQRRVIGEAIQKGKSRGTDEDLPTSDSQAE